MTRPHGNTWIRRGWLPVLVVFLSIGPADEYTRVGAPWWLQFSVTSALGVASGLALFARRRHPYLVMGVALGTYAVQIALGPTAIPLAALVMMYVIARSSGSPLRTTGVFLASLGAVGAATMLNDSRLRGGFDCFLLVAVTMAGLLRGASLNRQAAKRQDAVLAERLRIARDLHDVVGHGIGAITVQAGAARMAVAAGASEDATRSLLAIETAGRDVLREVRWLVGLLRDSDERPALTALPALVGIARHSGLDVDLTVEGELATVPADTGEAAYRIAQEALTNVVRHSGTACAAVRVRVAQSLHVQVCDPGSAPLATMTEGNGVRGMRERAAALGGTISVGPDKAGGWAVRAELPLRVRG